MTLAIFIWQKRELISEVFTLFSIGHPWAGARAGPPCSPHVPESEYLLSVACSPGVGCTFCFSLFWCGNQKTWCVLDTCTWDYVDRVTRGFATLCMFPLDGESTLETDFGIVSRVIPECKAVGAWGEIAEVALWVSIGMHVQTHRCACTGTHPWTHTPTQSWRRDCFCLEIRFPAGKSCSLGLFTHIGMLRVQATQYDGVIVPQIWKSCVWSRDMQVITKDTAIERLH